MATSRIYQVGILLKCNFDVWKLMNRTARINNRTTLRTIKLILSFRLTLVEKNELGFINTVFLSQRNTLPYTNRVDVTEREKFLEFRAK